MAARGDKLREWKKANMYRLSIDLNRTTDKPLIEKLEQQESKAAYVRGLIRHDIEKGEE